MSAVGNLIKAELEKRDWSIRRLASYADLSNTAVGDAMRDDKPKPTSDLLIKIARGFGISPLPLLQAAGYLGTTEGVSVTPRNGRKIEVIGRIKAGPAALAAMEDVEEMEITEDLADQGVEYGLRVSGDSMRDAGIVDGTIVFVKPVEDIQSVIGKIAVVMIDRQDACVKQVLYRDHKVILHSENPNYPDMPYDEDDVSILGEVMDSLTHHR